MKLGGTSAAQKGKVGKKEAPIPVDNLRKVRRFGSRIAPSCLEKVTSGDFIDFTQLSIAGRRRANRASLSSEWNERQRTERVGWPTSPDGANGHVRAAGRMNAAEANEAVLS
jgi:hypothetical protein